jgi:hypothetical protein
MSPIKLLISSNFMVEIYKKRRMNAKAHRIIEGTKKISKL